MIERKIKSEKFKSKVRFPHEFVGLCKTDKKRDFERSAFFCAQPYPCIVYIYIQEPR